ncbi:sugar-binding protein [Cocleimonas flava]|uniref:Carbohydrate binding protein with CBM9 domain n=1 Tax=Cocleimonas flava TaxID=634765 RepID=A0A4R1F3R5_9GAMM|nr:sugar-binding protein [Cocleimonas flava]TCJ87194.1 carbohydrate binding protein with CBM9 domain [Cocleimonas flava]
MNYLSKKLKPKKLQRAGIIGLLFILQCTIFTHYSYAGPNTRSPLGVNSNEVMDDDASIPFIDVFKTSIPFEEARPWLTKGKVEYDEHGWPKNLNGGKAGTRFLYKLPKETVPEGNYTVLYDGEGILSYSDDAKLVSREPGKDIISIHAGKDKEFRVKLIIENSNAKNYLRNIRVLMPGGVCSNNPFKHVKDKRYCKGSRYLAFENYHESLIFNPAYLDYMKDFKVVRFMNMSGITRNPISSWDERPKLKDATWAGKQGVRGAPLEIMVALANRLNADPWFTLPHKADNNFVRQYAKYVKDNLKPGLKAYVEYTNEAWNSIFTQAHYVKDMGERMQLDEDRDKAGYKYFSLRSVQIFDMWEQTFGGTDRIVRVMGSWTGWTRLSEMLLSYRNAYKKTDAIAIAPYFFPSFKSAQKARSVSQLFKLMYDPKEKYSIPKVLGYIHKNAETAKKFGVDLIAYEGGQHLVDWKSRNVTSHPTKLMIEANKDWRMAKAYSVFMQGWRDNGGKLFVNFSAPRTYQWFGSWGTKEYITQPINKAPKHRALMQYARKNPCWWRGCTSQTVARLDKPANNPVGDVYALVPSKKKKNVPGKTLANPAMVAKAKAQAKPAAKPKVVAKATPPKANTNTPAIAKAAVKTVTTAAKTAASVSNPATKTTATAAVAASVAKPIWETATAAAKPAQKIVTPKAQKPTPKLATAKQDHDAVVHRVKGRGRFWSNKAALHLRNIVDGRINGGSDLSGVWQTHWDNQYLHVRVDALDDKFMRDSQAPWGDDSIEIFVDADGSRNNKFDGKNDFHFIYRWKDRNVNLSKSSPRKRTLGIKQTMTRTDKGYTLETSIPWTTLGVRPVAGRNIGIDVQINDDDSGNGRDGKLAWHATNDQAWKNPQTFGKLVLGI